MTDNAAERPWLRFRITGNDPGGVDVRALADILEELARATRFIADELIGLGRPRGALSQLERSLAAFRVVSVSLGSFDMALAAPPLAATGDEAGQEADSLTPDMVAGALIEEIEAVSRVELSPLGGYERRHAVERLMCSAARIGDSVDVAHCSAEGRDMRAQVQLTRAVLVTAGLTSAPRADSNRNAGKRVVWLRRQLHVRDIERQGGLAHPLKSIEELAREQGLLDRPPADYPALLADLWDTEEEAAAFRDEIRRGRSASR